MTARRIIISDTATGTLWNTNTLIPLFQPLVAPYNQPKPFYDGDLIRDPLRLSIARTGNELKVLWYGNRTDDKIERVKGKIFIEGSPDIKWTNIVAKDTREDVDNVNILGSNNKVVQFDMVVNAANDSFVARYDLGSQTDACVEKPLIIFDKNAADATGTMADQEITTLGTATALRANTFQRSGYTFAGWDTTAAGDGTDYANTANYTMPIARNITLYAQWTLNVATSYTITFNANDALATGTMTAQTLTSGLSANLTTNGFTKPGYTFAGWSTTAA